MDTSNKVYRASGTVLQSGGVEASPQRLGDASRKNLSVYIGVFLLLSGLFLSAAALESLVLPEGSLVGTSRRAVTWAVCRILLAAAGIVFLVKRPQFTVVHAWACIFGSAITAILAASLLQIVYVPPKIESGWRSHAPKAEHNQFGFRGHPIVYSTSDFVVLLLGDSQPEAMALPFGTMPERLLESALNSDNRKVKVFTLGTGGYGQDQELLALDEYFHKYRADLVIVWETPLNDVWNNVFPTNMPGFTPKPTYWLQDGQLQGPTETLGQPLTSSRLAFWELGQRLIERRDFEGRDKVWERRLPPAYRPLDHYMGTVNREWQDGWETNEGRMRDENLGNEKSHMAPTLSPRSERMQYGLDLTRALLKRIEDAANSHGAQLVVFLHDGDSLPEEDEMHILNGKYYLVSKKQFVANLNYLNQGFQTEVIPITVKDWKVSANNSHLNLQANEQVLSDLAKRLRRRLPDTIEVVPGRN